MGTQPEAESDFNVLQFEKQLTSLKDSQDSINTCCQWCLQNRVHHKKIVNAWLNVLKRVKVEQRLILFYLANDVVQYSKRRNYEYVDSWGTAIQKATTMVRDDRVKHKILRIFKIWEQRGVYNEEFISDLCGLLSVVPSGPKSDEPHEFQPNYVVNKIKTCANLEKDTDVKLKILKEHNPKIQIDDGLIASLKDRAHVDDVEKEVDVYVTHMENYINALKLEIKNRITLITVLKQAETQLEADRKDVKIVANAYKMFGTRVKTFQKKLDEHKATLSSPIPSPDINAPSPSPDSDIELPEGDTTTTHPKDAPTEYDPKADLQQYANAGYYNPVASSITTNSTSSFISNGFSSFIGSDISFNLENLSNTIGSNSQKPPEDTQPTNSYSSVASLAVQNPPLPVEAPSVTPSNYSYNTEHLPLLPPPMPPFSKSERSYGDSTYNLSYTANTSTTNYDGIYNSTTTYEVSTPMYKPSESSATIPNFVEESYEPPIGANPYPPSEEYNPEDNIVSWDQETEWNKTQKTDTPESPPLFEKEGYSDPIEYHDNIISSGALDVDHRVLPGIEGDLEDDSLSSLGGKDVDHRNLISLTGSPGTLIHPVEDNIWNQTDQDYRVTLGSSTTDQDYRTNNFNIEQLKLPPPPPPSPKLSGSSNTFLSPHTNSDNFKPPLTSSVSKSPRKIDNTESIDMDLSDDDIEHKLHQKHNDNLKVIVDNSKNELTFSLEPPPPLPDLPDDVDANNFLDDLSNDLHEFSNLSDDLSNSNAPLQESHMLNRPPLMPPQVMHFSDFNPQVMADPTNTNLNPTNPLMDPCGNSLMNPPPIAPISIPPPQHHWSFEEDLTPNWTNDEEPQPWFDTPEEEKQLNWMPQDMDITQPDWSVEHQNNWQQNNANVGFRGRGNNRSNFGKNFNRGGRGRGRGTNFTRGNAFRGGRGNSRSNRGYRPRGNFRGNFRGGF